MCDQCARLQAKNKRLIDLLKLARKIIKNQNRQLNDCRRYTWDVICKFKEIRAKGGLSGYQFKRWEGRSDVAGHLYYNILIIDWSTQFLEMLAKVKGL